MKGEYYKTKQSVKEYISLARDVNGMELICKLESFLPSGSSLLEIGSGPGTDWNLLKEKYHVVGSDNSKEFLAHLSSHNPDGIFVELDAITLDTEESFDGIFSNKVLHHLRDEELMESICRQHHILKPGGIVCHSFWKGEGSEVFKGLFVNYHTQNNLKELFGKMFTIALIEDYKEFESDDSIVLIGRRK